MKFSLECFLLTIVIYSSIAIFLSVKTSSDPPKRFSNISTIQPNPTFSIPVHTISPVPESSPVTCELHPNIFTPEELSSIYKFEQYGDCTVPTNDTLVYKNRILSVTCENPEETQYFYTQDQPIYGYGNKKGRVVWTTSQPRDKNIEFVFVKCGEKSVHTLPYNQYKASVESSANSKRVKLDPNGNQMNVLILTIDEVSKYSADRNLPIVVEFIKSLQKDEEFSEYFSSYEFIRPGLTAPFTATNLAEILYGEGIEKLLGTNPNINLKRQKIPFNDTSFRNNALWNFYSDLGYTTMFLHDSALDFVSPLIGQVVNCDHVFTNIWKYTWTVYGWKDSCDCQRCAGTRNAHVVSFDYTYQYFMNYRKNNKFAYVHLNGGHEYSGNVRTIDKDLVEFIKDFLRLVRKRNEDLAFWIIGDHGQKKIDTQFDYRMFFESNVPMTHLILSKNIEETWHLESTLLHNEDKLISRFDIHLTLKHLAYFPYNLPLDLTSLNHYNIENAYSLLIHKLKPNRTCEEIGSKIEFCVCSWFKPVQNSETEEIVIKELFSLAKQYFESRSERKLNCEPLEGFQVEQVLSFRLKELRYGFDTLYRMEIGNGKDRIEVSANFCTKDAIVESENILKHGVYPFQFFWVPEGRVFIQITKVVTEEKCIRDICDCVWSGDVQSLE